MDEITAKLLAASQGEMWGPHPLIRRMTNKKGEERLQQLWVSNARNLDWRDIPLFNAEGVFINEGDSAINTGPLAGIPAEAATKPVPTT